MKILIISLVFLISPISAFAEFIPFYESTRGLAMGGAQITAVNDETTALINPAGLGKLREGHFSFLDYEIQGNAETLSLVDFNPFEYWDPAIPFELMVENSDVDFHLKNQNLISIARRNFTLGVLHSNVISGQTDVSNLPSRIDYSQRRDLSVIIGVNKRLLEGRIKVGVTGKVIHRSEIQGSFDSSTSDFSFEDYGREGLGVGADVGVQLALPWKWLPTISGVWRDVGGTNYELTEGLLNETSDRPNETLPTIDLGFALYPIQWNFSRFTITGEYRDIENEYELENEMAKYHLGFEWNSWDRFFLRFGLNQGYWTAGLEFALQSIQIQLASFGKEIGDESRKIESRNHMLKVTIRF